MNAQDFINSVATGNAAEAKDTLNNLLSARAFEALETKKIEIAQTLFGGYQVEEEVELTQEEFDQLDELSKATLGSYVKKASGDAVTSQKGSTSFAFRSTAAKNPRVKDAAAKISDEEEARKEKRISGINKAATKLSK